MSARGAMSQAAAAAGEVERNSEGRAVTLTSFSVLVRLFTAFSHVLKPDVKDAFVQVRPAPNSATQTRSHFSFIVQAAEDSGQLHVQASCPTRSGALPHSGVVGKA